MNSTQNKYDKYTVLMSLYDKEHPEYLREALDSMLNQTVEPDELIIVEDGPLTEDLYRVVDEYLDKYSFIRIVKNPKNLGLGLALNEGIKVSKNELIARMDTDDVSKPDRCEKQLKCFNENSDLAIVGSYIDEFEHDVTNIISQRKVPTTHDEIYEFAKRRSAFNHPTVMYKKSAVLAEGGYKDLRRNQDVELFGRMLFNGYLASNINESLLWFRSSKDLACRRKSWENTKSYINTIHGFWKMGYSSFMDYLLVFLAQVAMFIIPVKAQSWIYKHFLRG